MPIFEETELPIDELVPNPRNARKHPQEQIDMLAASLKRFGQTRRALVRRENRMVVTGHGMIKAAQQLGWKRIKVILWDVDQKSADAYMLADNRLPEHGQDDRDLLGVLLSEIPEADHFAIGFSEGDIEALFKDHSNIAVHEIATNQVEDRFWISIKGPLADQARALDALKSAMADLPMVEVDLGISLSMAP